MAYDCKVYDKNGNLKKIVRSSEKFSGFTKNFHRLSAEQQITGAQPNLGLMYEKGQGVEQDYVEAHKWFNIFA